MSRLGKTATVLTVMNITDTLLSVTLQLSETLKWRSCQHLKFEVSKTHFRDYTLADWDETTMQATLLIDAGHQGPGANWARQLKTGQSLNFMGPGGGFHQPTAASNLLCIGDVSAIGHFTSLHLRKAPQQQLYALICHQQELPGSILNMPLIKLNDHLKGVAAWLQNEMFLMNDTTFYVAGNMQLVVQTRKLLKQMGAQQIKPAGFWE